MQNRPSDTARMPFAAKLPPRLKQTVALGLAAALLATPVLDAQVADAQGAPPPAPDPTPRPDPTSIWTIQDENASISAQSLTDRYYVNGLRLGWTSGTDAVPDFLASAGRLVWGDGQQRIAFDLSQQIFTPADASARIPPLGDEPYAGLLMGNFSLITDKADSRSTITASLGLVGPWALGEEVQNGFHDVIGQGHNNGWATQLHNEPAGEARSERVWRLPTGSLGGLETDVLPDLQGGVGNVRIYAEGGAALRIGQGLDSDYGVARADSGTRGGASGGDAFTPTRPFAWYVFVGADGQAVAHDITLDGNDFSNGRSVKLQPLIAEGEVGLAVMAYGARLTYTQVVQTQTFRHEKGGAHELGSLALSVRF
jgi:hypothetical protein